MYKINSFRKVEGKKNLRGYIDIYLPEKKWMIPGFSLFANGGKYWVNPPSRSYKNELGETKYFNLVQMSKEENEIFTKEVLAALKEYDDKAPKPYVEKKIEPVEKQDDMFDLPF